VQETFLSEEDLKHVDFARKAYLRGLAASKKVGQLLRDFPAKVSPALRDMMVPPYSTGRVQTEQVRFVLSMPCFGRSI